MKHQIWCRLPDTGEWRPIGWEWESREAAGHLVAYWRRAYPFYEYEVRPVAFAPRTVGSAS